MLGRIFFVTQASAQVGMGHFMRCYALAEEARATGSAVTFIMPPCPDVARDLIHRAGCELRAIEQLHLDQVLAALPAATPKSAEWVIIDSYQANSHWHDALRAHRQTLLIDDLGALNHYGADALLNPSESAGEDLYRAKGFTGRFLLGAKHACIRKEFQRPASGPSQAQTVVLTFGGSDPTQLTQACAKALTEALPEVPLRLIVGPANPHLDNIRQSISRWPQAEIWVNPVPLAPLLEDSALVVTAAGGSVGELCAIRALALALVVVDNQAAALSRCPYPVMDARSGLPGGFSAEVQRLLSLPMPERERLRDRAHARVDGKGCMRVLQVMQELSTHV
jgi:UDP-2,4-diacetamido-2,4,6-trideoxy-beta-L-altropyranose hydrolase